jgi:hypothetical protein
VEDVRASGDDARGGSGLSPTRRIARRGNIFMSSGSVLATLCHGDGMLMESDLVVTRLARTLSPHSLCSGDVVPIKILCVGAEGFGGVWTGPDGIRRTFWQARRGGWTC